MGKNTQKYLLLQVLVKYCDWYKRGCSREWCVKDKYEHKYKQKYEYKDNNLDVIGTKGGRKRVVCQVGFN